jgi:hypothetical protein
MSSIRTAVPAALFLAGALAAGSAQALSASFQQGVGGYAGAADTQLRGSEPDTAHGSVDEIGVDASDGGSPTQALLRFDGVFGNGMGQVPLNALITSATLTLQVTSAGSGFTLHELLQPLDFATITWNSTLDGIAADGVEAASTPLLTIGACDSGANVGEGALVIDFTTALRRVQDGSAPGHGWVMLPLMPGGTNGIDFISAEGGVLADRPLLQVQALPVPEPASALLLAGGLAAVAAARRRRQRR